MISGYETTLTALMEQRPEIFVLTAENKGPCIEIGERFPKQFLDVGIAEQALVGVAAGLARTGSVPIIHAMAAFLTMRAFEFIRTDVGHPRHPVKIVGTSAGFQSEANGFTHQAIEDIALMRAIPGVNIFCPADNEEMVAALPHLLDDGSPWYIRHNPSSAMRTHVPFQIGVAEVIGTGRDAAIVTCGLLVGEAVRAADRLRHVGVATRVVNLRCLRPFDKDALANTLEDCDQVVTLEDHLETGGVYSLVAEFAGTLSTHTPIRRMALSKAFRPALLPEAMQHAGLSEEHIFQAIMGVHK